MRVAILGAGSLGWAYGARLATRAGCDVTLVGRHAEPPKRVRLERVETGDAFEWTAPVVTEIPPADVVLCAVRYEQLESVAARVGRSTAPVVLLTPLMPSDHARLAAAVPAPVVAAMPSVVAYFAEPGRLRHWIPRVATTLVDARIADASGAASELATDLPARLTKAGIPARVERDVLAHNVATTVSFLPLMFGIDVADGVDPLLKDRALLSLALDGVREGEKLGQTFGPAAPWTGTVLRFLGPFTLKMGIAVVRSRAPEVLRYIDEHFGRKLHAQNLAMAQAMLALCGEKGVKSAALEKLAARLG
ncbi:MAG TPA: 2-dehydropantoate 2-reductase N-terminal domain-containing protein [Polyangiaceae bacterium]|jgi:hypothetical protein|nr:2-dehydropantoate 2-reductase N-terminal domain-containing protein [Polyangiaceae bacterium]